jgi:hypothetical protein
MADNVEANAGSGGATFASDDIGGVQYPRTKVVWGADGAANDASAAAPLPVVQTGALTVTIQDGGNTITVDGTVELGATALAALETITVASVTAAIPAGTNNIGDVDIASIAAGDNNIGNVDIASIAAGDNNIGNVDLASAIPAGTNLIGSVAAGLSTSAIYDGTTALTPKFAIIDAATSGDNTLVAAVNPKKIRVLACFMVAAGAVNARFESGAGGTALSGQMNLTTNSGFVLPFNPCGWFETASNTLLNLELSGAVSVDGSLVYVEV